MSNRIILEILFVASSVCTLLVASPPSSRFIGGVPAAPGEFPFVVTIQLNGSHIFGGLIYNERWILTSASCVEGITELRALEVIVADLRFLDDFEVDQESYPVGKIVLAPELDGKVGRNDLALLEVTGQIVFGENVNCVNIAEPEPTGSTTGVFIGYGATTNGGLTSTRLRKGEVTMNGDCTTWGTNFREAYMICAGSPSDAYKPCGYDFGSPLVQDGYAVGVLSQQINCQSFPFDSSIYTRLASYFAWIRQEASTQPNSCFRDTTTTPLTSYSTTTEISTVIMTTFTTPKMTTTDMVNYNCNSPPPFTCPGDGFYPLSSDACCAQYWVCVSGTAYLNTCYSPGDIFDPNECRCLPPSQSASCFNARHVNQSLRNFDTSTTSSADTQNMHLKKLGSMWLNLKDTKEPYSNNCVALELIQSMIKMAPEERPATETILNHSFFKEYNGEARVTVKQTNIEYEDINNNQHYELMSPSLVDPDITGYDVKDEPSIPNNSDGITADIKILFYFAWMEARG